MWRSGSTPQTDFATADSLSALSYNVLVIPGWSQGPHPEMTSTSIRFLRQRVELVGHGLRPTAVRRDFGTFSMTSIRPDNTDPIPLRSSPQGMGIITMRFVGWLFLAVMILALAWSR
jgi:hypothetical protein